MRNHIFGEELSWPMKIIAGLFVFVYRQAKQTLHGQGTRRLTDDEIAMFMLEIWTNINELLESSKNKPNIKDNDESFWLLGNKNPSEVDMVLYGMIVFVLISSA